MGKGSSSPPPQPDPAKTAEAQGQANKEAIQESSKLNAIDIYGPGGSTTYGRRPDGTPYSQTVNLNPTQQDIFDTQGLISKGLSGQAYGMMDWLPTESFNTGGVNYDPNAYGDLNMYDQSMAKAVYDRSLQFLEPTFEQESSRLHDQLVQQGFQPGNEAYETAVANQRRGVDQTRLAAANDAEIAGRSAAQQRIQTEQGLRSGTINEMLTERQQPFNEISAYLQGSPVFQQPQATGVQPLNMQAPDVMGATYNSYQGALNAWNAQNQNSASMWSNLAGLGGSALGGWASSGFASDEDQKEGFRDLGNGYPVLDMLQDLDMPEWSYRSDSPAYDGGRRHVGPMAQDLEAMFGIGDGRSVPAGVRTGGEYPDAFGLTLAAVKELDRKIDRRAAR
jgi:hypothetical protein